MLTATLTQGHRIASGLAQDPRFPDGTLALQFPLFQEHGLDLAARGLHPATLNLSIAPLTWKPLAPAHTFRQLAWTDHFPPEDFSFFDCQLTPPHTDTPLDALIYYPHPDTKPPDHPQSPSTLEVLAPKLKNIAYGDTFQIHLPPSQIEITNPPNANP
ncbi:MAG: hypothetical protein AAF591_11190 [Verrucomicrobiota bacterium]